MTAIPIDKLVNESKMTSFHWRVVLLCSLLMIVDGYDMVSYGSVVAVLREDWQLTLIEAGVLGSVALVGMLIGGMVIAPLADRYGRRPIIIASLVASAVASLGCALSVGVITLGISRTIVGISIGALAPNFISLVGEYAPRRSKAFLVCLVAGLYSAGGIMAALLAIVMIPAFGWRSVFLLATAFILLVPVMLKRLPESPEFLSRQPHRRAEFENVVSRIAPQVDSSTVVAVESVGAPKAPIAEIFRHGNAVNTVLIWVVFSMTMLLTYGLNTWLPTLMMSADYPLGSGLFNLVILNVGGLTGAITAGWLADRLGIKKIILSYFVLAALSLTALGFSPNALVLNLLLVVAGATTIGTMAIIHALAVEYYPSLVRSTGVGWAAGVGRIGAISGPVLGGALLGLALPFQQNFLAVAVPGVIAAVAIAFVRMSRSAAGQRHLQDSAGAQTRAAGDAVPAGRD
ncbi:aromatic acid/H+ symport family MFS transporter [Citricoccus alkalitolerans]|uniref:Aromatic acid/H+ symport family MFS transporter n=1 Tax=Citricoccus alkalitolerans TaxID=246603 RepID=A0ABV8XYJ4_9MICC